MERLTQACFGINKLPSTRELSFDQIKVPIIAIGKAYYYV